MNAGPSVERSFPSLGPSEVHGCSVRCVITRMRMRRPWHVALAYRRYRYIRKAVDQRRPPGLLQSAFLLEAPLTCYSLSLWDREPQFSAFVPEHIAAVNSSFGTFADSIDVGPEVWSTTWRLDTVSNNLGWAGFDLRALIASQKGSLRPIGETGHGS